MEEIKSKEQQESGTAFVKAESGIYGTKQAIAANRGVKYDLGGKFVGGTGLTRKVVTDHAVIQIFMQYM